MRLSIKGIPVKLSVRTQKGIDDFNRPTYEVSQEVVENVLVGEPSAEDVVNELNLSGKRIAYVLAIPKSDTHTWENTEVEFWGMTFKTVGIPTQGIDDNIPLQWNKKVKVERYE
ncbi:hypothetical protein [Ruminococcus sp.]|uniref:hypothetical protein n=1 Tax=Ruminococcus sp. TaxID=41978 RepID=UPI003FD7D9F1